MPITDTWLKANHRKPRAEVEEIPDRDGLGIRVSPKGKIVFQMRYRLGEKFCRLDLGAYPKTPLKAARAENERLRKKLEEGHDPRVVKLTEKKGIRTTESDTLNTLFKDWYDKYAVKKKPAHQEILRSFEIHVLPEYGDLPAAEVTLHHWLDLLEKLVTTAPSIADRILTNTKQMLKWGIKRRRLTANPLAQITAKEDLQIAKGIGTRSFNDEELVRVWNGIDRCHVRPRNKLFLKLCAVYGARHTELRKANKNHFDLVAKVWTVPPENHKMGKKTKKPLLRPITPEIEPLIRQAIAWSGESDYLFPKSGSEGGKGASSHLCLSVNLIIWLKKKDKYTMPHWSIKAFRKTARTNFSTLAPPHVAEIMLGHKLPGSWEVYDHYTYLKEQAEAYSAWCQRILRLTNTTDLLGADRWPRLDTFRPKAMESWVPSLEAWRSDISVPARAVPTPPPVLHPIG